MLLLLSELNPRLQVKKRMLAHIKISTLDSGLWALAQSLGEKNVGWHQHFRCRSLQLCTDRASTFLEAATLICTNIFFFSHPLYSSQSLKTPQRIWIKERIVDGVVSPVFIFISTVGMLSALQLEPQVEDPWTFLAVCNVHRVSDNSASIFAVSPKVINNCTLHSIKYVCDFWWCCES